MLSNADFLHFTTAGNTGTLGGTGSHGMLYTVNVGTGAASAVLTIKHGSSSGTTVAVIDASAKGSYTFNIKLSNGVYASLAGGNADCTIAYG